jgi:hypothetical protein
MLQGKVHILSCETRPALANGTRPRDLRLRTLLPLVHERGFVIKELCAGSPWPPRDFGMLKALAVARHAQQVPSDDLLIFTDSDVFFNPAARHGTAPSDVWRRFHQARGQSRIVFMSEPCVLALLP